MRLLRLWPENSKVQFMRWRTASFAFSAIMSVVIVALFFTHGLNFGIDFKGGTLAELQAKSGTANVAQVREHANALGFGEVEVQEFGGTSSLSLRFPIQEGGEAAQSNVVAKAREAFGSEYEFRRVETVGPRVSGELVQAGTVGVVLSLIAVLAYLWFRFERNLAMGALIGTLHDVLLTCGFFIITQFEFNMTSIAAILTIVGYSLNETVVVFDRTRELLRRYKSMPDIELLDLSINTTMARTAITSMTTFLSLLALVLFGGEAIEGFAVVMLIGIVICTYSAIFVSTPSLIYLGLRQSVSLAAVPQRP
jgi:preprotein translocase subunit SecF